MSFVIKNNKVLLKNGKVVTTRTETPFQLPNLQLYLSATRMPQYADNTALPSFLDYSGNLYHATQATTSWQPLFKTNQFGSNAGIKFDGVDDIMNLSGAALDIFRNINQFTVQALIKRSVLSVGAPIVQFTIDTQQYSRFILQFSGTNIQVAVRMLDSTSTAISILVPSNDLNTHLIQCTAISNVLYVYLDGVLAGSATMDSATSSNTRSLNAYVGGISGLFGSAIINGISVNTTYSNPQTIQAQYRGYLSRGYL